MDININYYTHDVDSLCEGQKICDFYIDPSVSNELERTWFELQGYLSMINQCVSLSTNGVETNQQVVDQILTEYIQAYTTHYVIWNYIMLTYLKGEFSGGDYFWSCDFVTNKVMINKGGAKNGSCSCKISN